MEALSRQSCAEHSDRHSQAVCMSCRKLLCQECTTQWAGINYCRACVGKFAAVPVRRQSAGRFILMIAFAIAIAVALVRLLVGIGVYFAGTF